MTKSLTDRDRDTLQRAGELADLTGADAVRAWAGTESYDVASTLSAYVELAGACQALLGDLAGIIRRLDDDADSEQAQRLQYELDLTLADNAAAGYGPEVDEDEPEEYRCATCGATIGIFIGHGEGWHHYRGNGTLDAPTELYDAGHQATPSPTP